MSTLESEFVHYLFALMCLQYNILQAYRLEPLINSHYAQVKPVKLCSAKSKISQDMVDHAKGPKPASEKPEQPTGKSWWSSQLQSVGTSLLNLASGKKAPAGGVSEPDGAQLPEKVMEIG